MDSKITDLTLVTALTANDVLPIVNGGSTKKVKVSQLGIPTQTSQLTNNGADGANPFITASDIPTTGQAGTLIREVKNMTGLTLVKGTVVYISGANGNKPLVSKALATTEATSARTFGLLQSNILNNGLGYCVIIGDLTGVNTSSFADGDQLYLSGTTAGAYTNVKTLAPTHLVYVGKVTRSHPTLGQIEVGVQNGYELEEIHDVAISNPVLGQVLSYDDTSGLWINYPIINDGFVDINNTWSGDYLFTQFETTNNYFNSYQRLAISGNAFRVNNTTSETYAQNAVFKNYNVAGYTETITVTTATGSPPSSTTSHLYTWGQVGNLVTITIQLSWANAGTNVTGFICPLPSALPIPNNPSATIGVVHSYGTGVLSANTSASATVGSAALRVKTVTPQSYEIYIQQTAGSYSRGYATIQYFTTIVTPV